jgi:hypothetical protein
MVRHLLDGHSGAVQSTEPGNQTSRIARQLDSGFAREDARPGTTPQNDFE